MLDLRRARLGFGASSLAFAITLAVAFAPPASVSARSHASPTPSASPSAVAPDAMGTAAPQTAPSVIGIPGTPQPAGGRVLNGGQPTPFPLNTLAPLGTGTPLPFPAYGSPVPGVNEGTPAPDVPATINLQQAIAIGFARSPLLQIARSDVAVQAAAVQLERSGLLPSIAGTAEIGYSHDQNGGGGSTISTGTGTTGTTGSTASTAITTGGNPYSSVNAQFGLSLAQLIYDGGKIAASVNADRRNEAATADTYRRELQTVAFNVANAYYTYLGAQRTTQVDLEIVREDVVQENLVRAQVRAGTTARADIATAQLPTAQARLAVVRAQGAELSAEAAFVNAMGLDANVKVQPVDDAPVFTSSQVSSIPVPPYAVAVARAIALRPDYDSVVQSLEASKLALRAAGLGRFPTLSANASASDDSTQQNIAAFRNSQAVGLNLNIPIFDQGITSANVASARANVDIANANVSNTALSVQLNVKQALTNLVAAGAALLETQQEYATALINVESTQAQYRAGVTTLPLLLNAQVQLTQALSDQVTTVYSLRENEQAYLYAIGANYDPAQFSLPNVARNGHGKPRTLAKRTLLQRLQAAIH